MFHPGGKFEMPHPFNQTVRSQGDDKVWFGMNNLHPGSKNQLQLLLNGDGKTINEDRDLGDCNHLVNFYVSLICCNEHKYSGSYNS